MLNVSDFECILPGSLFALRVSQFQLVKGEIAYLRGPSGSGKTTLFNLLTGVLPSRLGKECRRVFPRISYVMHESSLLPWLTVKQNAVAEESLCGYASVPGYFVELCSEFGLEASVLKRRTVKLSLGMRQRVEIAQALSFSPNLLVLDEAMAGIDAHTKSVIMSRICACVRTDGLTVLATSHQVGDILRFAQRVCSIENGLVDGEVVFKTPVEKRLRFSTEELLAMSEVSAVMST